MLNPTQNKEIEAEQIGIKDGKTLYKLMVNSVYGKIKEIFKHCIGVTFLRNEKDYEKLTS